MPRNTPMRKDWLMSGFATGMAVSVLKTITNNALQRAGVKTIPFAGLATSLVLGRHARLGGMIPNPPKNRKEWALGYLVDTLAGGFYGAATSYVLLKSPPGNELAKGTVAGALMAIGTIAVGQLLRVESLGGIGSDEAFSVIATGALYGGVQGYVMGKYASSMIDQSHPIMVKPVSEQAFHKERMKINRSVSAR